jgi:hypothetical protein
MSLHDAYALPNPDPGFLQQVEGRSLLYGRWESTDRTGIQSAARDAVKSIVDDVELNRMANFDVIPEETEEWLASLILYRSCLTSSRSRWRRHALSGVYRALRRSLIPLLIVILAGAFLLDRYPSLPLAACVAFLVIWFAVRIQPEFQNAISAHNLWVMTGADSFESARDAVTWWQRVSPVSHLS